MLNYSIMSLDEEHIDEFCADIEYQIKNNIATAPLFSMTLTPEGDPVIDKAAMYCEVYKKYKAKLDEKGLPSGVLIQASIGHGSRKLDRPSPLPKYIALVSGSEREICCPYAMKNNFPVYAGKHSQSDIRHLVGLKNMVDLVHSFF